MAEYGVTDSGFIPKRLAEIQTSINNNLENIVDPNTGETPFQNVSDDSILQQIVGVFAEACAEVWNASYQAYNQFDPLKNTGAGQSGTVQLNAIQRKPGASTIISLQVIGTPGTVILSGARVQGTSKDIYLTTTSVNIPEEGFVTVQASSESKGTFVPENGTVTTILTPVNGWKNVTNDGVVSVGSFEETDQELRFRQQRSTSLTSYRLIDSIYSSAFNVEGVSYARAYQNSKFYPTDERGIPFKEVALIVEGGNDEKIADELFLRLPTGQQGYGSTSVPRTDIQGVSYTISFSRPFSVDIFVKCKVKVFDRSLFPDNGAELIKQAIVEYSKYTVVLGVGFPPGEDIILSRLYTAINEIKGHSIEELTIGISEETLSTEDIEILWDQVGRFDVSRITVDVTS